jgi:hypothetical protein
VALRRSLDLLGTTRVADSMCHGLDLDLKAGRVRVSEVEGDGSVARADGVNQKVGLLIVGVQCRHDEFGT